MIKTQRSSKQHISELATFGGTPQFSEPLHVGRPLLGNRDRLLERFNDILDRRWLTNDGPYVQAFEQQVAKMVNVKHCIAVCNATIGLEIAVRALNLQGEVIVPSFTFIATAHALQWQGITPVFCDIAPGTHNLDPQAVESAITTRTTGILGVHVWGIPCNIEGLTKIAQDRHLRLFFDAAHAFGCSSQGTMIGSFGDLEVFSFHATKFINAFEGGIIATNSDEINEKVRLMRNFGFNGYDNVEHIGTNAKLPEFAAAMGLTSLESMEAFVDKNRANYQLYQKYLTSIPGIKMMAYDENEICNYQYIVLEVDEKGAGLSRDELITILHSENILARRYFYPGCHQMEPYRTLYPSASRLLANTESLTQRVMIMPTGSDVDEDTVVAIAALLSFVIGNGTAIREELRD